MILPHAVLCCRWRPDRPSALPAGIPPSHAICTDAIPLYIVFHISVFNLKFLFCCHKGYGRTLDFLKTFIPLLAIPASTSLLCSLMSIVSITVLFFSGEGSRPPAQLPSLKDQWFSVTVSFTYPALVHGT